MGGQRRDILNRTLIPRFFNFDSSCLFFFKKKSTKPKHVSEIKDKRGQGKGFGGRGFGKGGFKGGSKGGAAADAEHTSA